GLPAFQWSGWLWAAPDYTALSSQALTILWGAICYETVALIDGLEHGHWARPVFASQSIVIT
ncbi:MAG: hypothetical protein P4M15_08690, partial [Alphaproteobacteria bacterium]|nr:hypothetical protein [Alphaproteobacteria bacterium]